MRFNLGESHPILVKSPRCEAENLSELEKVNICYEANSFAPGIFPFVFLNERDTPR